MRNTYRKTASWILAILLTMSALPFAVSAEELPAEREEEAVETVEEEPAELEETELPEETEVFEEEPMEREREETLTAMEPIRYADANGNEYERVYYADIRDTLVYRNTVLNTGWYIVTGTYETTTRIDISGDVNLILCDGAELDAVKGIHNSCGNTLTIWPQKEGTGKLIVNTPGKGQAGIGGNDDESGGTLNIHGGYVEAHGLDSGAGIGGGNEGGGGTIRIYNGTVHGYGGHSIDIGCYTGYSAAGIGGGDDGNSGAIAVYGGDVYGVSTCEQFWGNIWGAGIGAGDDGDEEYIEITGGRAEGHGYQAFGCGDDGDNGILVLGDGINAGYNETIVPYTERYRFARSHDIYLVRS